VATKEKCNMLIDTKPGINIIIIIHTFIIFKLIVPKNLWNTDYFRIKVEFHSISIQSRYSYSTISQLQVLL